MKYLSGIMGKKIVYVAVLSLVLMPVPQAFSQTLNELVKETLQTNPEVQAAQSNMAAIKQMVRQAKAGYLPTVDFAAGYGTEYSDNSTTRAITNYHHETMGRGESSLSVNQMLFDGFRTKHDKARVEALYLAAKNNLNQTSESVAGNTLSAFLEVIKRHELLELIKDNVLLHQRSLKKIKRKVEVGGGNQVDVQQTESRLALASSSHAMGEIALKNSKARFFRITGQTVTELTRPDPVMDLIPNSLEKAWEIALVNHPGLQASQANLLAARAEKEGARSALFPKVNLELNYTNNGNISGAAGHSHSASAMVRLRYNLFSGWADEAKGDELMERINQRQELLEQARRTIREQVETTWETLQGTISRIAHLEKHQKISQEVTLSYHNQFKLGKRTFLDVLNSETELFNAKSTLVSAQIEYLKMVYQLLSQMGLVRQSLGIERSEG
ncbi:MAG: TolC family outer membrane protein [Magnetococcales bacterium]|nr:TolC family outer membrane protein [Magnetococcales bacterium]